MLFILIWVLILQLIMTDCISIPMENLQQLCTGLGIQLQTWSSQDQLQVILGKEQMTLMGP